MAKHRAELSAGPLSTSLPHTRASTLLTVDQVAERLNVAPSYVRRRLIFEKRIAYVKIGRHVRIESKVVDGLIEAGRIEAEAVAPASCVICRSPRSGMRRYRDGAHPQAPDNRQGAGPL